MPESERNQRSTSSVLFQIIDSDVARPKHRGYYTDATSNGSLFLPSDEEKTQRYESKKNVEEGLY